jgi:hypothetical protein
MNKIDIIIDEVFPAGSHSVRWNGNHQPNVALSPANVPRQTQSGTHWWNWYISCSWWRLSFKEIVAKKREIKLFYSLEHTLFQKNILTFIIVES